MILHTGTPPAPSKKLIVDLISRAGSPDSESLSPYDGMRGILKEQGIPDTMWGVVVELFKKSIPDYSAAHQKPMPGVYEPKDKRKPVPEGAEYLRRLEDIDVSWVRAYVTQQVIGLKTNEKNSLNEYRHDNRCAISFLDEDGTYRDVSDFYVEQHVVPPLEVASAKAKLPYLLKRLHDKSVQLGTSVISLMHAYEYAKREGSQGRIPSRALEYGVYQMDKGGNITYYYNTRSANTNAKFRTALSWIKGQTPDSYYRDAMELLHVCETLGIDFYAEDPLDFQAEQISNLKITYIRKNKDYLAGRYGVNHNVLTALSAVGVNEYVGYSGAPSQATDRLQDFVQRIIDSTSDQVVKLLSEETPRSQWGAFFRAFSAYCPGLRTPIEVRYRMSRLRGAIPEPGKRLIACLDDFYTDNGFLCKLGTEYELQPFPMCNIQAYEDYRSIAVVHISGYVFLVSAERDVEYTHISKLTEYLNQCTPKMSNKLSTIELYKGWSKCSV